MIKPAILVVFLFIYCQELASQSVSITEDKVEHLVQRMELHPVKVLQVKIMKKWKALDLSQEMKHHMDYNVVRVRYQVGDTVKTVLVDMHLVPIVRDSEIALE